MPWVGKVNVKPWVGLVLSVSRCVCFLCVKAPLVCLAVSGFESWQMSFVWNMKGACWVPSRERRPSLIFAWEFPSNVFACLLHGGCGLCMVFCLVQVCMAWMLPNLRVVWWGLSSREVEAWMHLRCSFHVFAWGVVFVCLGLSLLEAWVHESLAWHEFRYWGCGSRELTCCMVS